MHRKDYVLLEKVLREQYAARDPRVVALVASAIADALVKQNPGFDKGQFMNIVEGREPLPTNTPPAEYRKA